MIKDQQKRWTILIKDGTLRGPEYSGSNLGGQVVKVLLCPAELLTPMDQLSSNTRRRCEAALALWQTGEYELMLLTGGRFLPQSVQTQPAAEVMAEWFKRRGVAVDQIVVEHGSVDTYENIRLGMQRINSALTARHIFPISVEFTVCTQYQHCLRFLITFWLAHGIHIKTHAVRQPEMSWKDWCVEWLVLIPYHLYDWNGTGWVAETNRKKRHAASETY